MVVVAMIVMMPAIATEKNWTQKSFVHCESDVEGNEKKLID